MPSLSAIMTTGSMPSGTSSTEQYRYSPGCSSGSRAASSSVRSVTGFGRRRYVTNEKPSRWSTLTRSHSAGAMAGNNVSPASSSSMWVISSRSARPMTWA